MTRQDDGGLFLSMADILTFLSLLLIGLTYLVAPKADVHDPIAVDLPHLAQDDSSGTERPDGPFARWVASGGQCAVELFADVRLERMLESVGVPCSPRPFAETPTDARVRRLQDAARRYGRRVTLNCQRGAVEECGRLQWTLLDNGFAPRAAVIGSAS